MCIINYCVLLLLYRLFSNIIKSNENKGILYHNQISERVMFSVFNGESKIELYRMKAEES